MSDQIVFEEDDAGLAGLPTRPRQPRGFAARLVAWGVAPTEQAANYILIGVMVICFGLTLFLLLRGSSSPGASYGNNDQLHTDHPEVFLNNPVP